MALYLGLDFETKDPYIGMGLGAGWPTKVHYPFQSLFFPIGFSICWYNSETKKIENPNYYKSMPEYYNCNLEILVGLLKEADYIVMHNAQYDLGCLRSLGIPINDLKVFDTKIMGILYDNTLWSYSLDPLLAKYLGQKKAKNRLIDVIIQKNLCPNLKQTNKTFLRDAEKWAYSNMDVIQEMDFKAMADYANQDTKGMMELFRYYQTHNINMEQAAWYSHTQLICTKIREKGIAVDLQAVEDGINILSPVVKQNEQDLWKIFGQEFSLHSDELKVQMKKLGYDLPQTEAGNDSLNKEFLEDYPNDKVCGLLLEYRTNYILLNQFLVKIKEMQQYTAPEAYNGTGIGRVFPELNLLAARTGRFSSSNPNIQNIPKRNKLYASLCRAIFVPDNRDNNWYSLDWSNQEGRLQLHYAFLKGYSKTKYWHEQFHKNPKLDTHKLTAEMMFNVKYPEKGTKDEQEVWKRDYRTPAKTIYLGKSFCMGVAKTCKRLGLPTKIIDGKEVAGIKGKKLIDAYDAAFPYLKELQRGCADVSNNKGYITTLGGRKLKQLPKFKDKETNEWRKCDYKAISQLIQGSAADQMLIALHEADKGGIDIKCIVHDEFNIEGSLEDALKMKQIMETSVKLEVPTIVELSEGKSWGNLKNLD